MHACEVACCAGVGELSHIKGVCVCVCASVRELMHRAMSSNCGHVFGEVTHLVAMHST